MDLLSRTDEIYLVTILELGDNAYGVPIKKNVSQKLGKEVSYGGLYFALDQLVKKELVYKSSSEPEAKRGGRTKFYYHLTPIGKKALRQTHQHQLALWENISKAVLD